MLPVETCANNAEHENNKSPTDNSLTISLEIMQPPDSFCGLIEWSGAFANACVPAQNRIGLGRNERVTSNEPATLLDVKKVRIWDEHLISRDKTRQQGSSTARPVVKPEGPTSHAGTISIPALRVSSSICLVNFCDLIRHGLDA